MNDNIEENIAYFEVVNGTFVSGQHYPAGSGLAINRKSPEGLEAHTLLAGSCRIKPITKEAYEKIVQKAGGGTPAVSGAVLEEGSEEQADNTEGEPSDEDAKEDGGKKKGRR